jgi:hypothetical protein
MAIINPTLKIEVEDYNDFCNKFKINTDLIAGIDGADEELINRELEKNKSQNWNINFMDNKSGGYFVLQLFE